MAFSAETVIAHLVQSVDFERVLRTRSRMQSEHFALHHVASAPARRFRPAARPSADELSTGCEQPVDKPVDDSVAAAPEAAPDALWLGTVVPKKHAKRAVTRSLLKRQIRSAVEKTSPRLPVGLWVVRLRAPFDRQRFPSAASDALRHAARTELERLLAGASQPARPR